MTFCWTKVRNVDVNHIYLESGPIPKILRVILTYFMRTLNVFLINLHWGIDVVKNFYHS